MLSGPPRGPPIFATGGTAVPALPGPLQQRPVTTNPTSHFCEVEQMALASKVFSCTSLLLQAEHQRLVPASGGGPGGPQIASSGSGAIVPRPRPTVVALIAVLCWLSLHLEHLGCLMRQFWLSAAAAASSGAGKKQLQSLHVHTISTHH